MNNKLNSIMWVVLGIIIGMSIVVVSSNYAAKQEANKPETIKEKAARLFPAEESQIVGGVRTKPYTKYLVNGDTVVEFINNQGSLCVVHYTIKQMECK